MKVQLTVPKLVVVTVVGEVVWVVPSYLIVIVFVAPYPVPETVTTVPVIPLVVESVIVGVTVKVALAELEPSFASTVLAPAIEPVVEPVGTIIVAAKEPVASVVIGEGEVAIAVPANVTVIVPIALKP